MARKRKDGENNFVERCDKEKKIKRCRERERGRERRENALATR